MLCPAVAGNSVQITWMFSSKKLQWSTEQEKGEDAFTSNPILINLNFGISV